MTREFQCPVNVLTSFAFSFFRTKIFALLSAGLSKSNRFVPQVESDRPNWSTNEVTAFLVHNWNLKNISNELKIIRIILSYPWGHRPGSTFWKPSDVRSFHFLLHGKRQQRRPQTQLTLSWLFRRQQFYLYQFHCFNGLPERFGFWIRQLISDQRFYSLWALWSYWKWDAATSRI